MIIKLVHDYPIHLIGLGGVGSKIAEHLMRYDCGIVRELHLWDGDMVEGHNVRNQAYTRGDVGLSKVISLGRRAKTWGPVRPNLHMKFITEHEPLSGVVILCVDSMEARWRVWESCVRNNRGLRLFIETRTDALNATVYCLDPNDDYHVFQWEKYWYPDSDGFNEGAGCGTNPMPSSTAGLTAGLTAALLIRFVQMHSGMDDELENKTWASTKPFFIKTEFWRPKAES